MDITNIVKNLPMNTAMSLSHDELVVMLRGMFDENTMLMEQLTSMEEYSEHTIDCHSRYMYIDDNRVTEQGPCDCGLDTLRAELGFDLKRMIEDE
jgi:hypothetical protein